MTIRHLESPFFSYYAGLVYYIHPIFVSCAVVSDKISNLRIALHVSEGHNSEQRSASLSSLS